MPILKIALNSMLFEDALPDPFSVATQMFKSLIVAVSKMHLLQTSLQFSYASIFPLEDNMLVDLPRRILVFRIIVFLDFFPSLANLFIDVESGGVL